MNSNHNYQVPHVYENFFALTQSVEEFMFYRPIHAKGQRPTNPTTGIPLSYEEDCGIHLDQNGSPLDAPLVEKVVETLVALGMARGDTSGDKDEKALKLRGAREHDFFNLALTNMRGIAATVREHERARFLVSQLYLPLIYPCITYDCSWYAIAVLYRRVFAPDWKNETKLAYSVVPRVALPIYRGLSIVLHNLLRSVLYKYHSMPMTCIRALPMSKSRVCQRCLLNITQFLTNQ
jgi:hypothetical protein